MDMRRTAAPLKRLTVSRQRLDNLPQQDLEHLLPMPAALFAHIG